MNPFTSTTKTVNHYPCPTVDALRPYTLLNARERRRDVLRRRLEGFAIGVASVAVALLVARAPVVDSDADVSAAVAAETQKLAAQYAPCWDALPMRVAITQENINRLCIKPTPTGRRASIVLATKE